MTECEACGEIHDDYEHTPYLERTPHGHCESCNGHHSDCGPA